MTRGPLVDGSGAAATRLDAVELAELIRTRSLSPREVLAAHLERIEEVNPRLNAVVTLAADAEEQARAAELAVLRGDPLGPLHGVPFTIKDTFDTAGVRTTRGSRVFEDLVPDRDATAVARLKEAGGILLGKTNVPEFALWWETDNLIFGRTVNPWDAERTAGGSSGGEAAAIAAGLSPLGIGSDLGGSIRLPAHYCGVVGLKPTHGRVPLTGHFPETLLRYMHVGPLARKARDAGLALAIIAGSDRHDLFAPPVPAPAPPERESRLPSLRVGVPRTNSFGPVDAEVCAVLDRAAKALLELGHEVEEVAVPALESHDWNRRTTVIYLSEALPYVEASLDGNRERLHPFLRQRLGGLPGTFEEYLECGLAVDELRRDLSAAFATYDLLLCPTAPVWAPPHGATEILIDGESHTPRTSMRATIPFDLTGSPALTLPFGSSREGLPIAIQLVGRHFDETTLVALAADLETLRDSTTGPAAEQRRTR